MKAALLVLVFCSVSAYGQDPGMMAAQQSMQATQQATSQALQDMQQASQQANQQMMQNAADASSQNSGPVIAVTAQPAFSVKTGAVAQGTTVRIKCRTHYADIYYTTNGWSPTTASRRYTGTIPINATTQLQAIAVAPNMVKSLIARADYTVNGPAVRVLPLPLSTDGVLHAKTRLHLVTNSTVNSKTVDVGDKISILLDQDVKVGDVIVIQKGTPVDAVITQAVSSGHIGVPGDIAFEVQSLMVHGITVPLQGGETLEGANQIAKIKRLIFIPYLGAASLLMRGDEAEIKPGMTFTVAVSADTPLKP